MKRNGSADGGRGTIASLSGACDVLGIPKSDLNEPTRGIAFDDLFCGGREVSRDQGDVVSPR